MIGHSVVHNHISRKYALSCYYLLMPYVPLDVIPVAKLVEREVIYLRVRWHQKGLEQFFEFVSGVSGLELINEFDIKRFRTWRTNRQGKFEIQ